MTYTSYTDGFKARMVQRMAGSEGISATALSQEVGVSQSTLSRWLRERPVSRVEPMTNEKRSVSRSPMDKLRLVLEASELQESELGAFLRREGLHEAELREWVEAATTALSSTKQRKGRRKASPEAKRIRDLEKDLRRKEKALAELAALLALKKKLEAILGDEDDGTDTRSAT